MTNIKFAPVSPDDTFMIEQIAGWYFDEWKIPVDKTKAKLKAVTADSSQFQISMALDSNPIATGGLYNHVGLLDKEPRFSVYKNWLVLVYTIPDRRHQGYGALLCNYIQEHAKNLGIDKINLFTDTAEQLYRRLGWKEIERLNIGQRNIVVMEKNFTET